MAWVYILQSLKNGKYYIGSTLDIKQRLQHHLSGGTPSTRRLGPMNYIFSQKYHTLNEARSIERKLKQLKRKDYIEKIIRDGYIKTVPSNTRP